MNRSFNRSILMHSESFNAHRVSPKFLICHGALVLHTGGRYYYHDGTTWRTDEGITAVQWIRTFHCSPPAIGEDKWGIVAGLINDDRLIDFVWNATEIMLCLKEFVRTHQEEFGKVDGVSLNPLAKARLIKNKSRSPRFNEVAAAVDATMTVAKPDRIKSRIEHAQDRRRSRVRSC